MITRFSIGTLGLFALASLLIAPVANGQVVKEWTWRDASGKIRTIEEFENILRKHKEFAESERDVEEPGYFIADFSGADLSFANLAGARLPHIKLNRAKLVGANLRGAILFTADLTEADLSDANLADAALYSAILDRVNLYNADLTGAKLHSATLTNAYIYDTNMTNADLLYADVAGTIFEPRNNPLTRGLASAHNLASLRYRNNPDALMELRKELRDYGFQEQERTITYVIRKGRAQLLRKNSALCRGVFAVPLGILDCAAYTFDYVFFDLTCRYGASPSRPLILLVVAWGLFALVYMGFICFPGKSGLYLVATRNWGNKQRTHTCRIRPWPIQAHGQRRAWRLARKTLKLFANAFFFSILASLTLGFRDFNFGQWLRLAMPREYDIKAIGWARTTAGIQSLLSVFLIALWALSYFGHPFD